MVNNNWLVCVFTINNEKISFLPQKRFSEEKLSWAYTELCYTSLFLKTSTLLFTSIFLENDNFLFTQITLLSEYSQQSCLSDATKSKSSSNIVLSLEWTFSWNCRIVSCECVMSFFSKGLLLSEITSNSWEKNDM